MFVTICCYIGKSQCFYCHRWIWFFHYDVKTQRDGGIANKAGKEYRFWN